VANSSTLIFQGMKNKKDVMFKTHKNSALAEGDHRRDISEPSEIELDFRQYLSSVKLLTGKESTSKPFKLKASGGHQTEAAEKEETQVQEPSARLPK